MNQLERNKSILKKYIPEETIDTIANWIYRYDFKLKIKKSRSSKRGDYTPPHSRKNHQITINKDLNKFEFLITLVHEVAHLITWEKYNDKVNPHGREWKTEFRNLMRPFFFHSSPLGRSGGAAIFPEEIGRALHHHLQNPAAASCSDLHLSRTLKKYDERKKFLSLEQIPCGSQFKIAEGTRKTKEQFFVKGEKLRTRFKCLETKTRKEYFIHPLCEVILIQ